MSRSIKRGSSALGSDGCDHVSIKNAKNAKTTPDDVTDQVLVESPTEDYEKCMIVTIVTIVKIILVLIFNGLIVHRYGQGNGRIITE
jgi:hypothetical protein